MAGKKYNKKSEKGTNNSLVSTEILLSKWLPLIIALIALVTSLFNLSTSMINAEKIDMQKAEIESIKSCKGEVTAQINTPETDDAVSSSINVSGRSTIHESCRYIFLFVHDQSYPGDGWKVSDLVQINMDGTWSGTVLLNHIALGAKVEIDVRVTAQPKDYIIGQIYPIPPDKGVPSNIVNVRRVE